MSIPMEASPDHRIHKLRGKRWSPYAFADRAVSDDDLRPLFEAARWAKAAPVLALGCTSLNFALNGKPNAAAIHDLGLASASLTLEATARGLVVH